MEKPTSIRLKDFKNDAVNLVNNSGLPLFCIEPVLRELLSAVQTKAEEQYLTDKANYDKFLRENKTKEGMNHE